MDLTRMTGGRRGLVLSSASIDSYFLKRRQKILQGETAEISCALPFQLMPHEHVDLPLIDLRQDEPGLKTVPRHMTSRQTWKHLPQPSVHSTRRILLRYLPEEPAAP